MGVMQITLKASWVVDYSEGKPFIHLQSFLHVSFAVLRFGCHNPPLVFFLQLFCEINDVLEDLFYFSWFILYKRLVWMFKVLVRSRVGEAEADGGYRGGQGCERSRMNAVRNIWKSVQFFRCL